jgi:TPP-dependent trihydroxycyclohexane-1,2-dione (THcHDO) dehydratase
MNRQRWPWISRQSAGDMQRLFSRSEPCAYHLEFGFSVWGMKSVLLSA